MLNIPLRHADALLPTGLALLYVVLAYAGGFALLLMAPWWGWPLGVLAVAHSMVIASYLVHECAHNVIFAEAGDNVRLGRALLWINGACYGDYAAIRHKHMRHHVDRADVIAIDYRDILRRHPRLRRTVLILESIYIPAVDCLMHALIIVLPFTIDAYKAQRQRVLICGACRGTALLALLIYAWPAFIGYLLAYLLFEIVLRTMDMHQHTFAVVMSLEKPREPVVLDRIYEQRNTYSNTLGRSAWANLLVLNFGYHNAHHEQPTQPWYRLPALDKKLFGADNARHFSFRDVIASYRKYRAARVLGGSCDAAQARDANANANANANEIEFVGVLGVSFLTAI